MIGQVLNSVTIRVYNHFGFLFSHVLVILVKHLVSFTKFNVKLIIIIKLNRIPVKLGI